MTLKRSWSRVAALRATHPCNTLHFVKSLILNSGFASHSLYLSWAELNLAGQLNVSPLPVILKAQDNQKAKALQAHREQRLVLLVTLI